MRSSFSHPKSGPPRALESEVGGGCLPYCPQNCDLWKGHVSKNLFFFDDHLKCMHESHHLKPGKKSDLFKDPPHKTKKMNLCLIPRSTFTKRNDVLNLPSRVG